MFGVNLVIFLLLRIQFNYFLKIISWNFNFEGIEIIFDHTIIKFSIFITNFASLMWHIFSFFIYRISENKNAILIQKEHFFAYLASVCLWMNLVFLFLVATLGRVKSLDSGGKMTVYQPFHRHDLCYWPIFWKKLALCGFYSLDQNILLKQKLSILLLFFFLHLMAVKFLYFSAMQPFLLISSKTVVLCFSFITLSLCSYVYFCQLSQLSLSHSPIHKTLLLPFFTLTLCPIFVYISHYKS